MRKILVWILVVALVVALAMSGYIFFNNSNKKEEQEPVEEDVQEEQVYKEPEQEPIIDYGYLHVGEWGVASKYSSKKMEYEDVYVIVTQMARGELAEAIVKDYTQNFSYFEYNEPQEGMEWLVVDYVIDFGSYEKGQNGANSDIQTRIKGYGDNQNIVIGNKTYEVVTQDISNRDYTNAEQIAGRFATQIPIECQEYVVVFGNEEHSYCEFEGEKTFREEQFEENYEQNDEYDQGI